MFAGVSALRFGWRWVFLGGYLTLFGHTLGTPHPLLLPLAGVRDTDEQALG